MNKIFILITVGMFTYFNTHTMFLRPLSAIEKQLIQRKIKKRGLAEICKKIENNLSTISIHSDLKSEKRFNIILSIEDVFYKSEALTDPLAQEIFKKIEKKEKKSGYIPTQIIKTLSTGCKIINPTNYVGFYTRYYRLNTKEECVHIKAEFYNKEAVMKIINTYKE